MPLPVFTVTAGSFSEVVGADTAALKTVRVQFTPNVREGDFITWTGDDKLHRVKPVGHVVDSSGNLGTVELLAQDDSLSITNLQWRVDVYVGSSITKSWWFNALADGQSIDLKDIAPVAGTGAQGILRGERGYTPWLEPLGGGLYQAMDPDGPVGDPIEIAPPPTKTIFGPRWVFDGDSITINGIGHAEDRAGSWTTELADLAMGRINYVRNAAVAGERSDQRLADFDTDVAPHNPDVVFFTLGTNDLRQDVPMATWLANLDAYLAKVRSIGAEPIVGAIWPISDTAPHTATALTWNAALVSWAATNGVLRVPWDRLADPATGGWPSGWSSDNIHPSLLDSYSKIGKFVYDLIEPRLGPGVAVRRAVTNAESLLTNGFFTTLNTVLGLPTALSATPSTASGSLPAGTYSYKVTSRGSYGEGLPATITDAVLSGTGQITVAATGAGGSRGVNIYRKGPGDTDWKFVYYKPTAEANWVDTGAVTPGAVMTGIDTSAAPTGLGRNSSTAVHAIDGPPLFTETGIRGNVLRLRKSGVVDGDYFAVNVTPGQVLDCSCLYRAPADGVGGVALRWRSGTGGSGTLIGQSYVYRQIATAGVWRLVHVRATVPSGVASVRVSFETFDTNISYIDVAEARLALVA